MIFFNINNNTSVVMEIKHFNSENGVDRALQQILERVCAKYILVTENKILLGVFLAREGKISVNCLVNFDEKNSPKVIMEGRVETPCFHKQHKSKFRKKNRRAMYITNKTVRYLGSFEREQALDENFSMFFFKLIYNVRQIRYGRSEWLCVVR
jgi:hypothetical protein